MNDRIEIYHRLFDPEFNLLSYTEHERREIDALNLQTAQRHHSPTADSFPEDPRGIDPRVLHWRSSAYATVRPGPGGMLELHEHPLTGIPPHHLPEPQPRPVLGHHESRLGHAINHAIERDALRKVEIFNPEPGTQLRHVFHTTPSARLLHFDFVHDPPPHDELDAVPGHVLRLGPDNRIYLDWANLEAVFMHLSMLFSLGHIRHWNPADDDPPETRKALVTWIWNGDHTQWTRTVRLVPPTYEP